VTSSFLSLDLFCRVVDNFGDIGVCWRFARHLAKDCGVFVRLWVDDFSVFSCIEPRLQLGASSQTIEGVAIHPWQEPFDIDSYGDAADIVVEAFACSLPHEVIAKILARSTAPVWVDLEYLSAENWVEGCHALPSIHPETGIKKTLFFPGFTKETGGLIREFGLIEARNTFQSSKNEQNIWRRHVKLPECEENILDVSLFCYKTAPIASLFDQLSVSTRPIRLFIPAGVASEAVSAWWGRPALLAGESVSKGSLTLCGVPFLSQMDYDRLLWTCQLNFVRGEDSLVRAIWAGRPLIWNIYPQEEGAHLPKLAAFLSKYSKNMGQEERETLADFHTMWNEESQLRKGSWNRFLGHLPALEETTRLWVDDLGQRPTLAEALLAFCSEKMNAENYKDKLS
jgi:uncharacterized repeat protein (TIGR03837 family)